MTFVNNKSPKTLVLKILSQVPLGKVTTYGYIAGLCGITPILVGWILGGMTDNEMTKYPWQRVVAKGGIISSLKLGPKGMLQIEMLRKEGVEVVDECVVDIEKVMWVGVS